MNRADEIERTLIKKFRKPIWNNFIKGIRQYELIKSGDRIAVCISGGKDSMLMAKCMQHLHKYSDVPFDVEYLVMNPGYNEKNYLKIVENAGTLGIPIKVFNTQIFRAVSKIENNPCYLCARMRRGYLYNEAKNMGCNKIALGHHYDDVIETILMGMLYGAQTQTMMPKLHSANFEGMELIRPLYLVREEDIIDWSRYNGLEFIRCACRFTENIQEYGDMESNSKRRETKRIIKKLKELNPTVESNIFRSMENVNLNTLISYKKDGKVVHFLDNYDD